MDKQAYRSSSGSVLRGTPSDVSHFKAFLNFLIAFNLGQAYIKTE